MNATMNKDVTDIDQAVAVLRSTDRGLKVMRDTLQMLDDGGLGLDQNGQAAFFTLVRLAFTTRPGTVMDAMRDTLRG